MLCPSTLILAILVSSTVGQLNVIRQFSTAGLFQSLRRLPTNPEASMTSTEIIANRGYPYEIHSVQTDDGYVLELHRIPYSPKNSDSNVKRKPVYLQHGVADSSAAFLTSATDNCLAYLLADKGYDVWLGNSRGTTHSRKHVKLDPSASEFWNFSYDEMGNYDVPASINYILRTTGQEKLVYIGHSLGGALFFIAMIRHPELNSKIDVMIGLAPASSVANVRTYYATLFRNFYLLRFYWNMMGTKAVYTNEGRDRRMQQMLCERTYLQAAICRQSLFATFGSDPANFNLEKLPVYNGHWPTGTSIRTTAQLAQNFNAGQVFQAYDYGADKNQQLYGSTTPMIYDLKKVTAPVYIFWGANDLSVTPKDVAWLSERLGNLQGIYRVDDANFNHLDFLLANNAKEMVYDRIFTLLPPPY